MVDANVDQATGVAADGQASSGEVVAVTGGKVV